MQQKQSKFIQLSKPAYFEIVKLPISLILVSATIISFIESIDSFILFSVKVIFFLVLIFALYWLVIIVYQLRYKEHEIVISQKELVDIIDIMIKHEKWHYGKIENNLITLQTASDLNEPHSIIHIRYFKDKLLIASIVKDFFANRNLFNSDGLKIVKRLLSIIKNYQNEGIVEPIPELKFSIERSISNNLDLKLTATEIISIIVSRIFSYGLSFVFIAAIFLIIFEFFNTDTITLDSVITFIFQLPIFGLILMVIFIHIGNDFQLFKNYRNHEK